MALFHDPFGAHGAVALSYSLRSYAFVLCGRAILTLFTHRLGWWIEQQFLAVDYAADCGEWCTVGVARAGRAGSFCDAKDQVNRRWATLARDEQ